MTTYHNQSIQLTKLRLSYHGTNKCEPAEPLPNNKPDIIIRDNKEGTCMLIDIAITGDRNVIKKEAEKILKHKDLMMKFSA